MAVDFKPRYIPTLNYELDHLQELGAILNELRNEESLCDVTVTVGHKSFRAHKAVLAASSGYFNAMFTGSFQESGLSEVFIPGDGEMFESLLEYAYTGRFYIPPDRATDVLASACYLQIRYAVEVCTEYLCSQLNQRQNGGKPCIKLKDVVKIWLTADNHGLFELRNSADRFISMDFWKFSKMDEFNEHMPLELLSDLLDRGELAESSSEEEILEACQSWLVYDWEQRKVHASHLLEKIRLGVVPADNIKILLLDNRMQEAPDCIKMLEDVLKLHTSKDILDEPLFQSHPEMFATRSTITALVAIGGDRATESGEFIQFFDEEEGCWQNLEKFATLRHNELINHCMVVAEGKLYLAGGKAYNYVDGGVLLYQSRKFYEYDTSRNEWRQLPSMLMAREHFTLVYLDGFIYAVGGVETDQTRGQQICSAERYNRLTEKWEILPNLPNQCYWPTAVAFEGKLMVYGPQEPEESIGQKSVYSLMVFFPTLHCWKSVWTEERITGVRQSLLMVESGVCYEIRFGKDSKPNVTQMELDLKKSKPTLQFGDEEDQDLCSSDYHEVCINGQFFVIVFDYVYKTNSLEALGERTAAEEAMWSRLCDVDGTKAVTCLTFDKLRLM